MIHRLLSALLAVLAFVVAPASRAATPPLAPTHENVAYGPAAANVLDFWRADSATATPVVIYIHGGGFRHGDKNAIRRNRIISECLAAGISFVSVEYRFLAPEVALQDCLHDCARAVQFVRHQAADWHLDPARVACYGESAGAGTSLWLAFHDDMADPKSSDPVRRESTRLTCAGAISPQFSYDLLRWTELFGAETVRRFGASYSSPGLYGLKTVEELRGPEGEKIRHDLDIIALITKDDPPVYLVAKRSAEPPQDVGDFLHSAKHAQALYEQCRKAGVPVVADIPAAGLHADESMPDFFFRELRKGIGRKGMRE